MVRTREAAISSVCLVLLSQQIGAQNSPSETFLDTVDVRVINIETVVTDRKGNRVAGLEPGDFRLLVDDEEVGIDYFSEIHEGRTVTSAETGDVAAVQPAPDASIRDAIPTNYLVFIEDVFPRGGHRNLVLRRLEEQLTGLGPADQVAIMAFDGLHLESMSSWTKSAPQLRQAFAKAAKRPAGGFFRDMERGAFAGGTDGATRFSSVVPFSQATGYATLLERQIREVIGAASTAIRVAGRPEGRRVMLLLAGGWPYEVLSPGDLVAATDPSFGFGSGWDTNLLSSINRMNSLDYYLLFPRGIELYQMLSDTANRMSYTLYPVDVPGLGGTGRGVTAETPGLTSRIATIGSPREALNEGTLVLLANQTGGKALLNDLRLDAFNRAMQDTRSYYWLGFQVDPQGDDRRHRVVVEVKQKGLRVRARKNYVDLSRQSGAAMATEAALYLREADDLGLVVTVGKSRETGDDQMEVPLRLSIPIADITAMPIEQGWATYLEVSVQVRDQRRNVSELETVPVNLLSKDEPEAGSRTVYEFSIQLRDEDHELAITVRDLPSEKTLTTYVRAKPANSGGR